jgi:hypothetical protein
MISAIRGIQFQSAHTLHVPRKSDFLQDALKSRPVDRVRLAGGILRVEPIVDAASYGIWLAGLIRNQATEFLYDRLEAWPSWWHEAC